MKELGIYRVYDEDYPKVHIGDFIICRQSEGMVWIQDDVVGDGAEFREELLEAVIRSFYNGHF